MLNEMLENLKLPPLKSREEMFSILEKELFGALPPKPENVHYEIKEDIHPKFAGKAKTNRITVTCTVAGKEFSFPFHTIIPVKEGKHPFFVMPNFRPEIPDRHMPAEEIIDRGFAILVFNYKDITSDDGDLTNGLAGVLYENGKREKADCGKISMWAWTAMRLMDYAEKELSDVLDIKNAAVCGHSRLGKTALWTAANDPRFAFCYSNGSGCAGASLARGNKGESIDDICRRFDYWFCENYWEYRNNEEKLPFDQHYLIASIAPRKVLVGSASEDAWADPKNEYLSCVAASPAWQENSLKNPDRLTTDNERFHEGDLAYQIRPGTHYFSREDWNGLMDYILLHKK